MAEAFWGPISTGMFVRHINGKSGDNRLFNLEVVTPRENALRHRVRRGEDHYNSVMTEGDVVAMRMLSQQGYGLAALSRAFGVGMGVAQSVVNRRSWAWLPNAPAESEEVAA